MLSIEKCRELIPNSDKYPDEYIERVRDDTHALVELIFDVWLERRNKERNDKRRTS